MKTLLIVVVVLSFIVVGLAASLYSLTKTLKWKQEQIDGFYTPAEFNLIVLGTPVANLPTTRGDKISYEPHTDLVIKEITVNTGTGDMTISGYTREYAKDSAEKIDDLLKDGDK
jgi:hypothetical protein